MIPQTQQPPKYDCLACLDTNRTHTFIFEKGVYESLVNNNLQILGMSNFQDKHIHTLTSGEVSFDNVYVIKNIHHLNNLYKLTDGKVTEWKANFIYAENCENCMTKAFIRHESESKGDKPRKKKRFD